jgi:hypothetical protein
VILYEKMRRKRNVTIAAQGDIAALFAKAKQRKGLTSTLRVGVGL